MQQNSSPFCDFCSKMSHKTPSSCVCLLRTTVHFTLLFVWSLQYDGHTLSFQVPHLYVLGPKEFWLSVRSIGVAVAPNCARRIVKMLIFVLVTNIVLLRDFMYTIPVKKFILRTTYLSISMKPIMFHIKT